VHAPSVHAAPLELVESQSSAVQQPVIDTQPTPGQNFCEPLQVHLLATQVGAPNPPQSLAMSQQPAAPVESKPHAPAVQVRLWQALPVGHSLAAQQPDDGTQLGGVRLEQ
jgi:hypothetical protein